MSQWWRVIALDRREKFRDLCHLEELLYDVMASHLVMTLAVPVKRGYSKKNA